MSKNHLTAIFKRAAGTTVARYILYKRMTIARKELAGGTPAAEQHLKPDLEIIPALPGVPEDVWLCAFRPTGNGTAGYG